ncbi:hypothetical protein NIES4074_36370 [Cylindrospermum sp. NIES-4074]|nr:hypothetical protein NIES4074_36370 [Cylindrospermum sp. NIES-4074]
MLAIAIREQSNLSAQIKEWGFTDIPTDVVQAIDDFQDIEYLEICTFIAAAVLDDLAK